MDGIGITDNFFDLGGHSLLAMRLLAEIHRVFGQRLPVATVFRAQTVEQMAAVLSQRTVKAWWSVVTLQPLGHPPAVVCGSRQRMATRSHMPILPDFWVPTNLYMCFNPSVSRVIANLWNESRRSPNISLQKSAKSNRTGPTAWQASVSAESWPSRWPSN